MSANSIKPYGSTKGMGSLTKARFGAGMLLEHDDLDALADYTQELSRLLFRSFFGCGVICGLKVSVGQKCGKVQVSVANGVALDCCGDPLHVRGAKPILMEGCDPPLEGSLWVLLCAKYQCCAPRASMCVSGDESQEAPVVCTRERYGWEIRVVKNRPECACGCEPLDQLHDSPCQCVDPAHPCYKDHYLGKCGCECPEGEPCQCYCIVLSKLVNDGDNDAPDWRAEHKWRRFIRPVLIEDPLVISEYKALAAAKVRDGADAAPNGNGGG